MRTFVLQAYNANLELISEYHLELVTSPSGLGFQQKITRVETDTLDYITHQKVNKKSIKLTVNFDGPNAYYKSRMLRNWICNYIQKRCVLKYDDGEGRETFPASVMYIDIQIEELDVTELNAGVNSVPLTIQPLSPWYIMGRKIVRASIATASKTYPYTYPYTYGSLSITEEERTINNTFFKPIPLLIRFKGKITSPEVSLKDNNDEIYTTISFPNVVLEEGQILEVNAIDRNVLFYESSNAKGVDYYNYQDHSKDTYLFAEAGINKIVVNLDQTIVNNDGTRPSIEIVYIQFIM